MRAQSFVLTVASVSPRFRLRCPSARARAVYVGALVLEDKNLHFLSLHGENRKDIFLERAYFFKSWFPHQFRLQCILVLCSPSVRKLSREKERKVINFHLF